MKAHFTHSGWHLTATRRRVFAASVVSGNRLGASPSGGKTKPEGRPLQTEPTPPTPIEIRIHGRGGQGAVIASELLSVAVFREGRHVQSFPAFGVERRGAPVTAFIRIDDEPILLRCEIYEPHHLIVLDPTLLDAVNVTAGLRPGGWIVINTPRRPEDFPRLSDFRVATVDASAVALRHGLGSRTHPIVNTAILGAFARATGIVGLEAVLEAVRELVPQHLEENLAAAREAYERVVVGEKPKMAQERPKAAACT